MTDKLEGFISDTFKKQLIRKILKNVRETLDREREKLEKIEYSFIDKEIEEFIRQKIEEIDETREAIKLYVNYHYLKIVACNSSFR